MSTESPPPTFGELLRAARKRAGLTQDEAAKLFGVSKGLWWNWEKDRVLPPCDSEYLTQESVVEVFAPSFGDKLKYARAGAGYSQEQAARKLGVSRTTLWSWEKNESLPPKFAERPTRENLIALLNRAK